MISTAFMTYSKSYVFKVNARTLIEFKVLNENRVVILLRLDGIQDYINVMTKETAYEEFVKVLRRLDNFYMKIKGFKTLEPTSCGVIVMISCLSDVFIAKKPFPVRYFSSNKCSFII